MSLLLLVTETQLQSLRWLQTNLCNRNPASLHNRLYPHNRSSVLRNLILLVPLHIPYTLISNPDVLLPEHLRSTRIHQFKQP